MDKFLVVNIGGTITVKKECDSEQEAVEYIKNNNLDKCHGIIEIRK